MNSLFFFSFCSNLNFFFVFSNKQQERFVWQWKSFNVFFRIFSFIVFLFTMFDASLFSSSSSSSLLIICWLDNCSQNGKKKSSGILCGFNNNNSKNNDPRNPAKEKKRKKRVNSGYRTTQHKQEMQKKHFSFLLSGFQIKKLQLN